jgi:hypothetical protein
MSQAPTLSLAINLLILQGFMGGFDTLYHHELTVNLPQRPSARLELSIHAIRSLLYGLVFVGIAHVAFQGVWALALAALICLEVVLTLWDFVTEDQSRKLPATERILHTVLAINGGALFAFYGWELAHWFTLPTALVPMDYGWRGWLLTFFGVGVSVSGLRDGMAVRRLNGLPAPSNPFLGLPHYRVLITGGTGFIGEPMVNRLLDAGHAVTLLARDPLRASYLFAGRARCVKSLDTLAPDDAFDAVINLAGAPVVGPRWSPRRKARLLASRIDTTRTLMDWRVKTQHKPAVWIQASAIGFYGVRDPAETLNEDSPAGHGFVTDLCTRWEEAAKPAVKLGVRQVVLRLGLVFGPGGALPPLVLPFRLGLGGRLGDGNQAMSWIHREDVLALIAQALVDETMSGVYNAVAPEAVTQSEFAATVGRILRRPVWLHIPAAPIRWLAGEMAQLFVDGQRVIPARLLEAGYNSIKVSPRLCRGLTKV